MSDPNRLLAYAWDMRDTDLPERHAFVGVSMHLSKDQATQFFQQDRQRDRRAVAEDTWTVYYGPGFEKGDVQQCLAPHSYYNAIATVGLVASPDFYQFVVQSTGEQWKGIFVSAPTLRFLPTLKLVRPSQKLDKLVADHCGDYGDRLITLDGVLKEISDDTSRWYEDINR